MNTPIHAASLEAHSAEWPGGGETPRAVAETYEEVPT